MFVETKREGEAKTVEPWRQLLLDAADEIERRGHCHNRQFDEQGRCCFHGALSLKAQDWALDRRATAAMREHLGLPLHLQHDGYASGIASWNNKHTGQEVIAAMRACARA